MSRADHYRKQAADCLDEAAKTKDSRTKAQWEKLAEEWERLADAAGSRPNIFDGK